jgi:colanic acid/amylovoran biosynthesis glycosyltransferase
MSLPRRIAYLCGHYPAVSHTFILREVNALRRLGADVRTLSIRPAQDHELLCDLDREAFETTYAVLPPKPGDLVAAHLRGLLTRPARYFATLGLAMSLSRPGLRGRLWALFYFAEAIVLWRQCVKQGVTHVHAVFANVAADVALLVAHFGDGRRGERWTWSLAVHGSTEFYDVYNHRLREKVERAELVTCISDFCRSQLMMQVDTEHWDKMRVVHCGVDLADFSPNGNRPAASTDSVELLCVGRMVHLKGYGLVVEAIAELRRRGLDVTATFVGEGPSRAEVEGAARDAGIAQHVTFAGAVAQDEMSRYYERADIFCMSSFAEGLPVVLIEAMAMKLPVVSTRVAAIPELVEDGVSGLLVPPARADLLADAIEALARDPERRRAMGEAGRRAVASEFDVHRSAQQLHEIFSSSLADR